MPKNSKLNLLILENNPDDQQSLIELLHSSELKIKSIYAVNDLTKAVNLIREEGIDAILCSISADNGIAFFTAIKQYAATIPIIIISGNADKKIALDTVKLGAQDYLIKEEFGKKLVEKTILFCIERMYILDALNKSNERYNFVSKVTNDMVWDWNLLTGVVYRNKEGWKKIYKDFDNESEFTDEKDWYARVHPADASVIKQLEEHLYGPAKPKSFNMELRALRNDGKYAFVDVRGYIIRNEEGRPIRIIGATIDITERKKSEEELKKLSLIAKETVNAVIITDPDEKIQWVNEAFCRLTMNIAMTLFQRLNLMK